MEKNIGEKIRNIRNKAKLSQSRFGYKMGLSGKTISAYETGKIEPPLKVLEAISDEYNENLIVPPTQHRNKLLNNIKRIEASIEEIKNLTGIYD